MEFEEGKIYQGKSVTRLYFRNNYTEQEARKFFTELMEWSKEKIEKNIKLIYSVSLEELEEEALRGVFIGTRD